MSYQREIPRDLFNESKLLKCLGQLVLLTQDRNYKSVEWVFENPEKGFVVWQSEEDGSIFVENLELRINGTYCHLSTPLNSKRPYPLWLTGPDPDSIEVFEDDGTLTVEFLELIMGGNNCKSSGG